MYIFLFNQAVPEMGPARSKKLSSHRNATHFRYFLRRAASEAAENSTLTILSLSTLTAGDSSSTWVKPQDYILYPLAKKNRNNSYSVYASLDGSFHMTLKLN